jgi:outer membrane lipoprotein SlyB
MIEAQRRAARSPALLSARSGFDMTTSLLFQAKFITCIAVASAISLISLTACGPQNGDAIAAPSSASAVHKQARKAPVNPEPAVVQRPVASATLGAVSSIEPITSVPRTSGVGAVAGGVLGAVLGHQVGDGNGQKAATVVGAVGGAVAGNQIEKQRSEAVTGYRVQVRMDNGESRTFEESNLNGLNVGDRVRVEGGQLRRG